MTSGGTIQRFSLNPPVVSVKMILRLQKYRDIAAVPRRIRDSAEKAAREASGLAESQVLLWRGPLSRVEADGTIALGGGQCFHSLTFARLLTGSTELCALLLTVGEGIERRAGQLVDDGRLLEGLMMDTCGWAMVSLSLRAARRKVAETEKSRNCRFTSASAPGYSDWPLVEQKTLFELFAGEPLPISLDDWQTMLPRKSISSVFGVIREPLP